MQTKRSSLPRVDNTRVKHSYDQSLSCSSIEYVFDRRSMKNIWQV